MNIKKINIENAFEGLDGSTIEVEPSQINVPNKNEYFAGFAAVALGIVSILFGFFYYADFDIGIKLTSETWIFLVLGILVFVTGTILVLKAAVYRLTLKPFLKNAKFTKCNIKCLIDYKPIGESGDRDFRPYYL